MQQEGTMALFRYWNRLRDGKSAPARTDIEPADIKNLLADTFILERDVRNEPVFRLAGTRICAVFGRELKGYSFTLLWRTQDHRMMRRLVKGVFTDRSVAVIEFEAHSAGGRSALFEMLLLPLDAGRQNPRSLGLLAACERNYWLGADPVTDCSIESLRIVDPDRDPLFLKNRPAVPISASIGPGEAANDTKSGKNRRKQPHLVVLEGGLSDLQDGRRK